MSRTVRISAGDRDYIWLRATDITGENVSGLGPADVVAGLSTDDQPPAVAIPLTGASDQVQHPAAATLRAGLFVAADSSINDGAHVVTPGRYVGWLKPTDAPSSAWVRCGMVLLI